MNENEKILVSVCCAAYNHEKYIEETLNGFIMQKTNFCFEVLVNDDASTDHTKEIIQRYTNKYPNIIVPIYQSENQYSKKKNIIRSIWHNNAKGKYIAFCEGDDFWIDPYKLQKQYDVLEKNDDCSMCVCTVQCVRENGETMNKCIPDSSLSIVEGSISDIEMAKLLFEKVGYPFQTSGYFIKRDIYCRLRDEEWAAYLNLDIAMLGIAMQYGNIYYLKEIMSCWRSESISSWTLDFKKPNSEMRMNHYKKYLKACELYNVETQFKYNEEMTLCILNIIDIIYDYDRNFSKAYVTKIEKNKIINIRKLSIRTKIKLVMVTRILNIYMLLKRLKKSLRSFKF